jgi:hypothetical protein
MDTEIEAMSKISDALEGLEPEAIRRVLRWATERYQVKVNLSSTGPIQLSGQAGPPSDFDEFHELFDASNPMTSVEKALVAAYWFQVIQKHDDLDSQQLNSELKQLGHPSSNITRDLEALINRSPRFVMQVRKEGSTKQARKKYRLTREGIRAVEKMLTHPHGNENGNGNSSH